MSAAAAAYWCHWFCYLDPRPPDPSFMLLSTHQNANQSATTCKHMQYCRYFTITILLCILPYKEKAFYLPGNSNSPLLETLKQSRQRLSPCNSLPPATPVESRITSVFQTPLTVWTALVHPHYWRAKARELASSAAFNRDYTKSCATGLQPKEKLKISKP